jgi:hypothetical protein
VDTDFNLMKRPKTTIRAHRITDEEGSRIEAVEERVYQMDTLKELKDLCRWRKVRLHQDGEPVELEDGRKIEYWQAKGR